MLRIDNCVRFIPSHYMRRRFPLFSALEFRCCGEITLVNQNLTFDEIITCITRHDDFHRDVIE